MLHYNFSISFAWRLAILSRWMGISLIKISVFLQFLHETTGFHPQIKCQTARQKSKPFRNEIMCLFINFTQIILDQEIRSRGMSRQSLTHSLNTFVAVYAAAMFASTRGASLFQPLVAWCEDRDDNQWNIYTIMKRLVKFIQNRERVENFSYYFYCCVSFSTGWALALIPEGLQMSFQFLLAPTLLLSLAFYLHILLMMSLEDVCEIHEIY